MALRFNTSYLNRTPNKTARNTQSFRPEFVVMHETAGYGSLQWNLRPEVRSSYNYLIVRSGEIFHYVDERAYVAWHSGVNSSARGYVGGQINTYSIGVELEGPNDGTPITTAQTQAMVALLRYFNETYAIPLTRDYIIAHKDVAPGYKVDPRGYSVEFTLKLIRESAGEVIVRPATLGAALRNEVYRLAGGEYRPDWKFHQLAREWDLGSPLRVGLDFTTKGVRYTGEVYGRDIIISPYNRWDIVIRANELTDDQVYNDLMHFAYSVLSVNYHPEQAFARYVRGRDFSIALAESIRMRAASGRLYAVQLYAGDALITPINANGPTDWTLVYEASSLRESPLDEAERNAVQRLITEAFYRRVGITYDPANPLMAKATEWDVGAPFSNMRNWSFDGADYIYIVHASDTLFVRRDAPTVVQRLSDFQD